MQQNYTNCKYTKRKNHAVEPLGVLKFEFAVRQTPFGIPFNLSNDKVRFLYFSSPRGKPLVH